MSNGGRALLVVLASSAIGAAYFSYLTAVPCPPEKGTGGGWGVPLGILNGRLIKLGGRFS